ncbi:glycerophosphoryl diester phosphodiesterase membrane domain-containing protein [Treponema pedis]|uniref:Glycerophosphoryl diester phosphodiesterase membrane domain-containing protein n=3 Tax=Treponema pedis TaxID=409322 RepID=A0A7S6WNE4_9SPIR|nr:glycerophosphoryl diester phosphodiesterase membrane domain-containing protein [Treponema pedis]QOW59792.1 glycerophosphoryl diester phosphodiesterase membrane domain-containing protein [Treponema pedis]
MVKGKVDTEAGITSSLYYRLSIIWLFIKYQLVTKALLGMIILPGYSSCVKYFIRLSGRTGISSGDFLSFLFSFNGAGVLLITLLLMVLLIGVDINAFIIISAFIKEQKFKITARSVLIAGIKSLKAFLKPSGILIMCYVSLIFPIIGLGITVSPMKSFQIPNFIISVIYGNGLYFSIYIAVILFFIYLSFRSVFSFHFIILYGYTVKKGIKSSWGLTKKYKKEFLKDFFFRYLKPAVFILIFFAVSIILLYSLTVFEFAAKEWVRILLLFLLLNTAELGIFILFLFIPIIIFRITELFYKYNKKEGEGIRFLKTSETEGFKKKKIRVKTKFFILLFFIIVTAVNIFISLILSFNFDAFFKDYNKIEIIAHRGGGNLGAENTLEGILSAIKENVEWTEIDVQRTKDGYYIINHDKTFARLCGEPRASDEMTLEEIKRLKVKNEFTENAPSQNVASLEEVIKVARDRIGLFIELKGKTADTKMADDIVKMLQNENMENQSVLLSLDYSLIKYIKTKYPQIKTGYLYFFSIGNTDELVGDYLIMEEREATFENIENIRQKGKKAIVWTVNTDDSIQKFIYSSVDGIITDYVISVKEAIEERNNKTDLELILDNFFLTD